MMATVRKNFEGFTRRQVEKALLSRVVRRRIGHPSEERFKSIVSANADNFDFPIETADIDNANSMLGPDRAGLRGWSVRKRPKQREI